MRIDNTVINRLNQVNVLSYIKNAGTTHRAEISRKIGISIPTVMKICQKLLDLELIREVGQGKSSGGKPPMLIEFVSNSYLSIGVDVGATKIKVALLDCSANVLYEKNMVTDDEKSFEKVMNNTSSLIEELLKCCEDDKHKIVGIGIGLPGIIDAVNGKVIYSPDLKWENCDVVGLIKRKFGLETYIDNINRVMALGEKNFGQLKQLRNFMVVNLGYGIGAGLVINGELYSGFKGTAGEFGHMTMAKDGHLCDCGNIGCLEAISSARAIARDAQERIKAGEKSLITSMVKNIQEIEAKTVFDAAKREDKLAQEIIDNAVEYLGAALAGVVNLLDIEAIILGGGVTNAGEILTDMITKAINRHRMKYVGEDTKLIISEFYSNSGIIGASSLIIDDLISHGKIMDIVLEKNEKGRRASL